MKTLRVIFVLCSLFSVLCLVFTVLHTVQCAHFAAHFTMYTLYTVHGITGIRNTFALFSQPAETTQYALQKKQHWTLCYTTLKTHYTFLQTCTLLLRYSNKHYT